MPTLYLRNFDETLYRRLRARARRMRRSVTQEALAILEDSLGGKASSDVWRRIDLLREEARRRYGEMPSSVPLIRQDRER